MGTAASHATLVDEGVRMREDLSSSSLPLPFEVSSIEDVKSSGALKDFLLHNFDSEYLIRSLLQPTEEDILLKHFKSLRSRDGNDAIPRHYAAMQDCARSGIKTKLSETISIVEENLCLNAKVDAFPFLMSTQRRLAAFNIVGECVKHEQATHVLASFQRGWANSTLNSISNPEVRVLGGLKSFGVDMLRMFGLHLRSLLLTSAEARAPIVQLCNELIQLNQLSLFSCWSPRSKCPMLLARIESAESSTGNGMAAIDAQSGVGWSCSGGWWSAKLPAQHVHWVKASWLPSGIHAIDKLGAPERLVIMIRTKDSNDFERVLTVCPDQVKAEQGSWEQYYLVDRANVVEIRLCFSARQCAHNKSEASTLYGFEVYRLDDKVDWIDSRLLLHELQGALLPLMSIEPLQDSTLAAVLSLLKSAGSLSMVIAFIRFILSEGVVPSLQCGGVHVKNLLAAICERDNSLREAFNSEYCCIADSSFRAKFSIDRKYGECVLMDDDMTAHVEAESTVGCVLSCDLSGGVIEVSLEVSDTSCVEIGVVDKVCNVLEASAGLWLVHCGSGKITPASSARPLNLASMGERITCKLSYNASTRMVTLIYNGENKGVVFENVPCGGHPVVVVRKPSSSVRVKVTGASKTFCSKSTLLEPMAVSDCLSKESMLSSVDCAAIMLRQLELLAEAKMGALLVLGSGKKNEYLESPFCLDVSLQTFRDLILLCQEMLDRGQYDSVVSVLRLLELQFLALHQSQISLQLAEFSVEEILNASTTWAESSGDVMKLLNEVLIKCVRAENPTVRGAAARAFSRGLPVFLPSVAERITAAISVFSDVFDHDQRDSRTLITMLLTSLSTRDVIRELVRTECSDEFTASVKTLLGHVFATTRRIDDLFMESKLSAEDATLFQALKNFVTTLLECISAAYTDGADGHALGAQPNSYPLLLLRFCIEGLVHCGIQSISAVDKLCAEPYQVQSDADRLLRASVLGRIVLPLLCTSAWQGLALCALPEIVGPLSKLLNSLCAACAHSPICRKALWLISTNSLGCGRVEHVTTTGGGWKAVRNAVFEEFDNSFAISDQGSTYTSIHSSNTCAIVSTKFSAGQRAAWEFLLESDSVGDECSVFGAARQPLTSRCYSSSTDLWMRRAYNGYMYNQGQSTGANLEKIHPGDVVRIEFDGPAGTLSFSINGSEPEVGFTDITDDIYPACGSYRNSVSIKLLKVEVFELKACVERDVEASNFARIEEPLWQSNAQSASCRDPSVLCNHKERSKAAPQVWLTDTCNTGALVGVHDWAFETVAPGVPYAFGVVVGDSPPPDCVKLASSWELDDADSIHESGYSRHNILAFAWHSDGSLWFNGIKQGCFGAQALPLRERSSVVVRIDRTAGTIGFYVNGSFIGHAFGPPGSGAACEMHLPSIDLACCVDDSHRRLHMARPAASVFGDGSIRLEAAGMMGSIVTPFLLTMRQTAASVLSRLLVRLLGGNSIGKEEKDLLHWLQSPLFVGGLDSRLVGLLRSKEAWMAPLCSDGEVGPNEPLTDVEAFVVRLATVDPSIALEQSEVVALYDQLERLDPDPVFLRTALERSGAYRFPQCELPFIACLLRQSGLAAEAQRLITSPPSTDDLPPSEDMFMLWQKVKQLRTQLRQKRQHFRQLEGALASSGAPLDILQEIETAVQVMEGKAFTLSLDIEWFAQTDCCSKLGDAAQCEVRAVGVDHINELGYVLCGVKYAQELGPTAEGVLNIDAMEFSDPLSIVISEAHKEKVIVQRFTLAKAHNRVSVPSALSAEFSFRKAEFSVTKISFECPASRQPEVPTSKFKRHLEFTRQRALFVLALSSNLHSLDSITRHALLGLTSRFSSLSGATSLFRNKAELSRWRTQERWKRVVEFLRVHSKIKRQYSSDDMPTVPEEGNARGGRATADEVDLGAALADGSCLAVDARCDMSNTQAALQACAVFVSSEDVKCSATLLCSLMRMRRERATQRMSALMVLNTTLSSPHIAEDPFVLFDVLAAIENAFSSSPLAKDNQLEFLQDESHYLKYLEGCDAKQLAQVQQAFSSVFQTCSTLLGSYVLSWETRHGAEVAPHARAIITEIDREGDKLAYPSHIYARSILLMLRMWMIRFSTRDFAWIVQSNILSILHKLSSLAFHERVAQSWLDTARGWLGQAAKTLAASCKHNRALWSPEFVEGGLLEGHISARHVVLHSLMVAWSRLDEADFEAVGAPAALKRDLCDWTVPDATRLYCRVGCKLRDLMDKKDRERKLKDAEREQALAQETEALIQRNSLCGMFDPSSKAAEIRLSGANMIATLREDESGTTVCAYATTHISTSSGDMFATTGNYFEITVNELGHADIGVGFADHDIFSVRTQMPGWLSHSYGYHGDDGKKYGANATPGDWPTFEVGDVIGCGYSHERQAIFYTRNGELLGDGFTNVVENNLRPIVGFANRHLATLEVKVNFGLEPFAYSGDAVIVNPLVTAALLAGPVAAPVLARADESGDDQSVVLLSADDHAVHLWRHARAVDKADAHMYTSFRLRHISHLLLEYFLGICSKKALDRIEDRSPGVLGSDGRSTRLLLTKELSTYGTPKAVTLADRQYLSQSIISAMLHECIVGSKYVLALAAGRPATATSLEDALLGCDTAVTGADGVSVLAKHEAMDRVCKNLRALLIFIDASLSVRTELSSTKALACLFTALRCGSTAGQLVLSILSMLLPSLDPDFVESAMTSLWKDDLNKVEDVLAKCHCKKRTRKIPDSLIRVLFLIGGQMFRFGDEFDDISRSSECEFAHGSQAADQVKCVQALGLVRDLFEAPQWCELVASCVTDAVRHAQIAMNRLASDEVEGSGLIVSVTCAALSIFNQLPCILPGSVVEVEGSGRALVIHTSESQSALQVVLESCRADFYCKRNVETVERTRARHVDRAVAVDLSRLSQPVLGHMVALAKEALRHAVSRVDSTGANFVATASARYPLRLCKSLFATIAAIVAKQPEALLDVMHEVDLVGDLVLHCKHRTHLSTLASLAELQDCWMLAQSRLLEVLHLGPAVVTPVAAVAVAAEGEQVSAREEQDAFPSVTDEYIGRVSSEAAPRIGGESGSVTGESSEITALTRSLERVEILRMATELGLNPDLCITVAEFFQLDMCKTEEALRLLAKNDMGYERPVDGEEHARLAAVPNTIQDENVTKNIAHLTSPTDSKFQPLPLFSRRLSVASSGLKVGDYVVESTCEGVDGQRYDRIVSVEEFLPAVDRLCVRSTAVDGDLVLCKDVHLSQFKAVQLFGTANADLHSLVLKLDWAVFVMSMRSVVLKLLVCGDVDLNPPARGQQHILPAVKILVSTAHDSLGEAISTVCSALASPRKWAQTSEEGAPQAAPEQDAIVSAMLEDATLSLQRVCEVNLVQSDSEESQPVRVHSTHPYPAPFRTFSKITLPSSSKGAQLIFDKRCATASEAANLKVYFSEESFISNQPEASFYGSDGEHGFKPLSTASKTVYFSFEAKENSDFSPLTLKAFGDTLKTEGTGIHRELSVFSTDVARVGLGDDDTLFNLFHEGEGVVEAGELATTVVPDVPGVLVGACMFEVEVRTTGNSDGVLSVGIVGDMDLSRSDRHVDLPSHQSAWCVQSSGAVFFKGQQLRHAESVAWKAGDIISVAWQVADGRCKVAFAVNQKWSMLFEDALALSAGMLPAVAWTGSKHKVIFNVGDGFPFIHAVPDSVACSFSSPPRSICSALSLRIPEHCWGYDFSVQPLTDLALELTRDFELIVTHKVDESVAATNRHLEGASGLWIWRARSSAGYHSMGDIVTTAPHPPCRGLLVHPSQCMSPTSFSLVFASTKVGLAVWRPVAPTGFVAMGDVVSLAGNVPPSTESVYCVPLWAVSPSEIKQRVVVVKKVGEQKSFTNASLWRVNHDFGYFFGSPYEVPSSDTKRADEFKHNGVGQCYQLARDVQALVIGEWYHEQDILLNPSVTWSEQVLTTLINMPAWRRLVITAPIFISLVNYLKSSLAVSPQRLVPILIAMVRHATHEKISLPLHNVKNLCKTILSDAIITLSKRAVVPKALMALIDLVVEIQTVHVLESGAKDCFTISRSIVRERTRLSLGEESKDEDCSRLAESKEEVVEAPAQGPWWERPSLSTTDVKVFRVIKHENLDNVFHKESALLKLKQVLKFLQAVNSAGDDDAHKLQARLDRSFPKLMTSKIWYERASVTAMVESSHPYAERRLQRTISFPGADKISVHFDQRCNLAPGDKLEFQHAGGESALVGPLSEAKLLKGLTFVTDRVVVTFAPAHDGPINATKEWGWAFVVCASGPVFESAEVRIDLDQALAESGEVVQAPASAPTLATSVAAGTSARAASGDAPAEEVGATEAPADCEALPVDADEVGSESSDEDSTDEHGQLRGSQQSATCGDEAMEDREIATIVRLGRVVKRGIIQVPHASQLLIKIHFNSAEVDEAQPSAQHQYALGVREPKGAVQFRRVKKGSCSSLEVADGSAAYELWALDSASYDSAIAPPPTVEDAAQLEQPSPIDGVPAPQMTIPEPVEDVPVASWQCSLCTLINPLDCAECSVCGNIRAAEGGLPTNGTTGWWCFGCTYINELRSTECAMCGRTLATGEAAAPARPEDEAVALIDSPNEAGNVDSEKAGRVEAPVASSRNCIAIVAKGVLSNPGRFETRLENAILTPGQIMTPLQVHHRVSCWSRAMDSALLEYLNNKTHRHSAAEVALSEPFALSKGFLTFQGDCLAHVGMLDVMMRAQLFGAFNKSLESLLPLIDLGSEDPLSLGANIRRNNRYLLSRIKLPLLDAEIAASTIQTGADLPAVVTLDNFKALAGRESGDRDPATAQNCFVQAFRQLHHKDTSLFRFVFSGDRVLQITFTGESGIDAGGVFREGMARVVEDLFSEHFSLFLRSPNGAQAVHAGMDKFVPNPKHTGPLALEMFEFVGRLMAMSVRVKMCLEFELPQLVWKKIVGEEATSWDLAEVDMIAAKQLEALEHCHDPLAPDTEPVLNEEAFQARFGSESGPLNFVYMGSDQEVREVCAGGARRPVTYENRLEYCHAVRTARLAEFDLQAAAMARGMGQVLSMRALLLFSANQVEELVCGSPKIDVALWKTNTESSGLPAATVALFWKVMETLTPKEQSGFVRFAWGRSRLPTRSEDFGTKMKLTNAGRAALPVSHTCFFSIEMPEYATEEEMRRGLLTVIHFGVGGVLNG